MQNNFEFRGEFLCDILASIGWEYYDASSRVGGTEQKVYPLYMTKEQNTFYKAFLPALDEVKKKHRCNRDTDLCLVMNLEPLIKDGIVLTNITDFENGTKGTIEIVCIRRLWCTMQESSKNFLRKKYAYQLEYKSDAHLYWLCSANGDKSALVRYTFADSRGQRRTNGSWELGPLMWTQVEDKPIQYTSDQYKPRLYTKFAGKNENFHPSGSE